MANSRSAKKRIRQTETRSERNRARRSRVRSTLRKVEEAIASGDKASAETAFKEAMPALHRGTQKGAFHRNTAGRKLSGLSRRINAM
jgi:small subunit ribosomal protein S20